MRAAVKFSTQKYTLTSLREALLWLNDWPGGVKLNYELASVFCDAFLWGTGLWEDCSSRALALPSSQLTIFPTRHLHSAPTSLADGDPRTRSLVLARNDDVSLLRFGSFIAPHFPHLSLLSTCHCGIFVASQHARCAVQHLPRYAFHSRRVELKPIESLVGKKYNLLRKRVEPAVYEVDQLLLGTILFTLAAFLFPTVLFYYLTFAAVRPFSPAPSLQLT